MRAPRLLAAVAAAGVCVTVGGVAYASIPDTGGVIHACSTRTSGALRLSDTGACTSKETSLSWNNVGPAGLTWQGQWSPGSSYQPRDAVVYQGSSCFCLFRAPSSDAVRAVNATAEFALDRITDAVLLHPSASSTSEATHPPERSTRNIQPRKG